MTKPLVRLAAILLTMATAHSWALTFQSLYSFPQDKSQGKHPQAALTVGPDGSLYGTASSGGTDDSGTAFKITTAGAFSVLGHFEKSTTGSSPSARLLNIGDGFLYGATESNSGTLGVTYGGTVFKLDPAGGLSVVFNLPGGSTGPKVPKALASGESNVLHVLGSSPGGVWRVPLGGGAPTIASQLSPTGSDGLFPNSLIRGMDGKLYGTTAGNTYSEGTANAQGTLFRTDGDGSNFTHLFEFHYTQSGAAPKSAMVQGPNGVFYGVTYAGGSFSDGCFYRFDPASFNPGSPGSGFTVLQYLDDVPSSEGDLLLASDGKIYGVSRGAGWGYVWRINTDGSGFQRIHQFNGTNGGDPAGGLVQAPDGFLYGTTKAGGNGSNGTIYRIDLGLPAPAANRPPVAILDRANSSGSAVNINVLANDFDADGDTLTVSIESQPTFGTAVVQLDGTITYSPTPGGGYAGHDEFRYRITDPAGLSSTALVIISDEPIAPIWQPGVYNGILNLDPALQGNAEIPRGQLIINVGATGVFTGKLYTQKKRLTVRGYFRQDGTAIAAVKIPRQGTALIFLAAGEGQSLTALLFGKETWSGSVHPMAPPTSTETKTFTVGIISGGALPEAYGFATMKIFPNGVVVALGKLPDGTKLTWATTRVLLGGEAAIPVFCEPMKGGVFAGIFGNITPANPAVFGGTARWIRPPAAKLTQPHPAGFSGQVNALVFPFTPPPRGVLPVDLGADQTGSAGIWGGTVGSVIEAPITVVGSRLVPAPPLQKFSINPKTGIFTGKIKVGTKTVSFQGAVWQPLNQGYGHFIFDKVPGVAGFVSE